MSSNIQQLEQRNSQLERELNESTLTAFYFIFFNCVLIFNNLKKIKTHQSKTWQ